jgi:hypothetical protein
MDYQVKVRVRNGRIVRKMRERGYEKLSQIYPAGSADYCRLCDLIGMKVSALRVDGNWRPEVLRLCEKLACVPEDLFNEQQMAAPLRKNCGETFMDWPQVESLIGSGGIEAVEAKHTVDTLLATLKPRQQTAVRMRMSGATWLEIGQELGVAQERARQIEARALLDMQKAARPRLKIAA